MDSVIVEARLDQPGRWLWLAKIFLVIPHFVVLAALWIATLFTTVVAGFAILFTGRYPRPLFDFAVGVLRWTWRVSYYFSGAFATDKYPPFSLHPETSYPADLDVRYPEHLSRGLVLIKWWLLAIPQYLVVAVLSGGWGGAHFGLIGVLALIAIVTVLVSGEYPTALYDLVVGFNRWTIRVGAYVLLLTDEYPPFRLDAGGTDPAAPVPGPPFTKPSGPVPVMSK